MPDPQPDAREVAKAREIVTAFGRREVGPGFTLEGASDYWTRLADSHIARGLAQRFAEGVKAGREEAAKIAADLNVGIATTPEGEAWNSAIRKAVAAILAGATS